MLPELRPGCWDEDHLEDRACAAGGAIMASSGEFHTDVRFCRMGASEQPELRLESGVFHTDVRFGRPASSSEILESDDVRPPLAQHCDKESTLLRPRRPRGGIARSVPSRQKVHLGREQLCRAAPCRKFGLCGSAALQRGPVDLLSRLAFEPPSSSANGLRMATIRDDPKR